MNFDDFLIKNVFIILIRKETKKTNIHFRDYLPTH